MNLLLLPFIFVSSYFQFIYLFIHLFNIFFHLVNLCVRSVYCPCINYIIKFELKSFEYNYNRNRYHIGDMQNSGQKWFHFNLFCHWSNSYSLFWFKNVINLNHPSLNIMSPHVFGNCVLNSIFIVSFVLTFGWNGASI